MNIDEDPAILLQQLGTKIIQFQQVPPQFPVLLQSFSEKLLRSSSKNDPNPVKITEDYQGSVYILSKLAISSHDVIPPEVFFLIFRTIAALNLHFFSVSKHEFSKFVAEFPISFVDPLMDSLVSHFFSLPDNSKVSIVSMAALLLFIYFSDNPDDNPFITKIKKYTEPKFDQIFNSLTMHLNSTPAILLFYTFIIQNHEFKNFVLSKSDVNWIFNLLPSVHKQKDPALELKLNLLLIFTKDSSFLFSISSQKSAVPKMLRELFTFVRHFLKEEQHHPSITSALSISINLSRKLSDFDSDTGELLIGLIRVLQVSKIGHRAVEYLKLITMFLESVLVHRLSNNVELLYAVMRSCDVVKKLSFIKDNCDDPEDVQRMITNIETIINHFNQKVVEMGDKVNDYDHMLNYLTQFVNEWQPTQLIVRDLPPVFDYHSNDTKASLKYFRVILLNDFNGIL